MRAAFKGGVALTLGLALAAAFAPPGLAAEATVLAPCRLAAPAAARLQCYDRRLRLARAALWPVPAEVDACMTIAAPGRRLSCLDGLSGAVPPVAQGNRANQSSPLPGGGGERSERTERNEQVRGPHPPAPPSPPPPTDTSFRWVVGGGLGLGSHSGSFDVSVDDDDGHAVLDRALGGTGLLAHAGLWWDHVWPHVSLGVEYLYFHDEADAGFTFPQGVLILNEPVAVGGSAELDAHTLFFNAAYRPGGGDEWGRGAVPFVGGGLGVAYGRLDLEGAVSSAFLGDNRPQKEVVVGAPAIQGFVGVEVPLTDKFYWIAQGRIAYYSGDLFGVDHQFTQMGMSLGIGGRF